MKIGLLQLDGKLPNLALMKLAKFYEEKGNEIFFIDNKIKVCFNQGLDLRLITDEKAEMLSKINYRDDQFKTKRIYFAWDNIKDEEIIVKGINKLISAGIKPQNIMIYVLVGFNSTFEEDMYRTKKLIDLKVKPFIMQFNRNSTKKRDPKLIDLARWINKRYYNFLAFEDYNGRKQR